VLIRHAIVPVRRVVWSVRGFTGKEERGSHRKLIVSISYRHHVLCIFRYESSLNGKALMPQIRSPEV
jgi:hypothetical protein